MNYTLEVTSTGNEFIDYKEHVHDEDLDISSSTNSFIPLNSLGKLPLNHALWECMPKEIEAKISRLLTLPNSDDFVFAMKETSNSWTNEEFIEWSLLHNENEYEEWEKKNRDELKIWNDNSNTSNRYCSYYKFSFDELINFLDGTMNENVSLDNFPIAVLATFNLLLERKFILEQISKN